MTTSKKRTTTIVAIVAILALGVGVAIAAYVGRARVTGSAASQPFSPVWSTATVASSADMTCNTLVDGSGNLALTITNAYPSGNCTVNGDIFLTASSGEDGKVTGVDLTLPTGWTAAVTTGCGVTVGRGIGSATPVGFQVTMTGSATPGGSSTFGNADGVAIAPVSANAPLAC